MSIKKVLYNVGEHGFSKVTEIEEVKNVVYLWDYTVFAIDGIGVEAIKIDKLNELLKNNDSKISGIDDLKEFLLNYFSDFSVECLGEIEISRDLLLFDVENQYFENLTDWESIRAIQEYNGNNWEWRLVENEIEIEISENNVNLDKYDGQNWYTGSIFSHENIYKVLIEDGKKVENLYFLKEYSQYAGSFTWGRIMTLEEVEEHLENLERSVGEYMEQIKVL